MTKAEKKQTVNGDAIIIGIDVAKRKHYAKIFDQIGLDVIKPLSVLAPYYLDLNDQHATIHSIS